MNFAGTFRITALLLCLPLSGTAAGDVPMFNDVLSALVEIRAEVPANARTAESLGIRREGSGVVIDEDGLIVTIGYLVMEASKVNVVWSGGISVAAQILAYDHASGFGLIRAQKPPHVRPMQLGRSQELGPSEPVLIASFGGMDTVRPARVVSRRVFAGYWEYLLEQAIYTAPPHPSFGGAALIDSDAKLVGIGSLLVSDAVAQSYLPGNMFVPIDVLTPIIDELVSKGRTSMPPRPWLGVYTEEVVAGLLVTRVAADSPATRAGIEADDILLAVAGEKITSLEDFYRKVWALGDAGISVPLTFLRGAKTNEIVVHSTDRHDWLRILSPKR